MSPFGSGVGIGGLASGLDTNSIVQKLVQLESIPLGQLDTKKSKQKDKLNGISKLKSLVKDLQTKAKAISTQSNFLVFDVKTSKDGVASFTVTGAAEAASHTLTVNQIAAVDRWAFDGVASSTTNLTTTAGQSVSFTANGNSYNIAVDQTTSSLENIASAINTSAAADVTATVVNSGTSTTPSYKLVLTSKKSGLDARISGITSTVTGLTIDATGPSGGGVSQSANNITVGLNAIAIVDGLSVERSSNEFTDVIAGVTFTAQSANPLEQITFSAEPNKPAVKKKVQDLVDAYNAIINYSNTQNSYNKDTGAGGVLFGDSILSSVRSSVQSALFSVPIDTVTNDTTGYSTLSIVGITTGSDGTLSIDQTKLDGKLTGNLAEFANLFVDKDGFDNGGAAVNTPEFYLDTTADSGLAATLVRSIDRMLSTAAGDAGTTVKGLFDTRSDTINKQILGINTDIQKKQDYIDKYQTQLISKFSRLESTIGRLNAQGAGFAAAIAGLR